VNLAVRTSLEEQIWSISTGWRENSKDTSDSRGGFPAFAVIVAAPDPARFRSDHTLSNVLQELFRLDAQSFHQKRIIPVFQKNLLQRHVHCIFGLEAPNNQPAGAIGKTPAGWQPYRLNRAFVFLELGGRQPIIRTFRLGPSEEGWDRKVPGTPGAPHPCRRSSDAQIKRLSIIDSTFDAVIPILRL
jgi:hypothetical protein